MAPADEPRFGWSRCGEGHRRSRRRVREAQADGRNLPEQRLLNGVADAPVAVDHQVGPTGSGLAEKVLTQDQRHGAQLPDIQRTRIGYFRLGCDPVAVKVGDRDCEGTKPLEPDDHDLFHWADGTDPLGDGEGPGHRERGWSGIS